MIVPAFAGLKRVSTGVTLYSPVFDRQARSRPSPFTCAKLPIQACVSFVTTGTETAAPTAAVPPPEMLPAMTFSVSVSSAATRTLPSAKIFAPFDEFVPSATYAFVVTLIDRDAGVDGDRRGAGEAAADGDREWRPRSTSRRP